MASFIIGKVKIEENNVGTDSGRWIVMYEFDCAPPPTGSEKTYNFDKGAGPMVLNQYIQAREMIALLEGANTPTHANDSAGILSEIQNNFGYQDLQIDEKNLPPGWKNGERCYKVMLSYRVKYDIIEIKATAAQQFTSGTDTYPAGDTVATFRILVPKQYEFMRSYQWNPECCNEVPKAKNSDLAGPFPELILIRWGLPQNWRDKPNFGLELDWWYKYKKYFNQDRGEGD
jgi:hypothetical protein